LEITYNSHEGYGPSVTKLFVICFYQHLDLLVCLYTRSIIFDWIF